ncbi:MAG TPA: succinate dehydrogenase, cytochrome b556 subunit [Acidimicrobiales bacterium]|nr:succinate dehydrogenase, cytochrome b556 subunit [Acidimicrobiales bacterium]
MSVTDGRPPARPVGPERSHERSPGRRPYRGRTGQWAFVGHRVSGFLVFFFLLLHIVDVSLVRWPATYDDVHAVYGNVVLRLFEVGLLFALVFHSLNGLRIVAVDFFPGAVKNERRLLSAVVVMTLLLGIPGAWMIMLPFVRGHF